MKLLYLLAVAGAAVAAPQMALEEKIQSLATRQAGGYYELTKGTACKDVTFIFVRGTFESAPVGAIIGPGLISAIRAKIPNLAAEGVAYPAAVQGNFQVGGGDPAGIKEAKKDYELAASKCPNTIIIGGGYSQGAAVTHRAVESLPQNVKDRIAGVVLYGDTQNKQDGGKIKNFPPEKTKVYCNGYGELKSASADGVCGGSLLVNAGHLSYSGTYANAATWLAGKVAELKAAKGGASS